jgi:TetR/AcrR family transcriptional regulator, cholesterol catabolism regulator
MSSPQPSKDGSASSISLRRRNARRDPSASYLRRRQRLLDAAAEVIKEKGLEATSVNDIAERLGTDRASVYYYYGGKQEIFLALVRHAVEEVVVVAETIAASQESSTVRLKRLMRAALDGYERNYPIMFLYIQEDMRRVPGDGSEAGAELQELGRRYEAALGKITRDGVNSGEFHEDLDDSLLKFAILGAMNWTHRWFVPGERLTGAEVGEAFADYLLRGVRRPRQRSRNDA